MPIELLEMNISPKQGQNMMAGGHRTNKHKKFTPLANDSLRRRKSSSSGFNSAFWKKKRSLVNPERRNRRKIAAKLERAEFLHRAQTRRDEILERYPSWSLYRSMMRRERKYGDSRTPNFLDLLREWDSWEFPDTDLDPYDSLWNGWVSPEPDNSPYRFSQPPLYPHFDNDDHSDSYLYLPQSGVSKEETNIPTQDVAFSFEDVNTAYDRFENLKSSNDNKYSKRAKSKRKAKGYKPQAGPYNITPSTFGDILDAYGERAKNSVFNHLENFSLLCVNLSQAQNLAGVSSVLLLYIKTIKNESLSLSLWSAIKGIFNPESPTDDDDCSIPDLFYPHSGGIDYMSAFKNLSGNFRLLVQNPAFTKISYLLSACVCLGLCEASSVTWSIAGLRLFSPDVYRKHVNAPDLFSAIIDTVTYFVEGGFEFFRTGSLHAFIYDSGKVRAIQDDFNWVRSNSVLYRSGSLHQAGISNSDYAYKLENVLTALKRAAPLAQASEKLTIERMIAQCYDIKVDFNATRTTGGIRPKPFSLLFVGSSGVGKSTICCALPPILGVLLGFDGSPEFCRTIRADDKYQQQMKSYVTCITLEDVFNTNANFLQTSPTDNIILMSNNAIAYANMADVESKGKVCFEHDLLLINSNLEDMGASIGSNEPASIERRVEAKIVMRVHPDFTTEGNISLDPKRVRNYYESKGLPVPVLPDVWLFDIMRPIVMANPSKGGVDKVFHTYHLDSEGNQLKGVNVETLIEWCKVYGRKFRADQRDMVERTNNTHKEVKLCRACDKVSYFCKCSSPDYGGSVPPTTCSPSSPKYEEGAFEVESGLFDDVIGDKTDKVKSFLSATYKTILISTARYAVAALPAAMVGGLVKFAYDQGYLLNDTGLTAGEYNRLLKALLLFRALCVLCFTTFAVVCYSKYACGASVLSMELNQCESEIYHSVWWCNPIFTLPLTVMMAYMVRHELTGTTHNRVANTNSVTRHTKDFVDVINTIKKVRLDYVLGASVALLTAYEAFKTIRAMQTSFFPQSRLVPDGEEDIKKMDKFSNPYMKPEVTPKPTNRKLKTATSEHVTTKVLNNMCHVTIFEGGDRLRGCDCLFLRTGLFVLPYHFMFRNKMKLSYSEGESTDMEMYFRRKSDTEDGRKVTGGVFRAYLSKDDWVRIPGKDFVVFRADCGGDFADITYLLAEDVYSGLATFVYKDQLGHIRKEGTEMQSPEDGNVKHVHFSFPGSHYRLSGGTHPGLCGAALITNDNAKRIAGLHLGGKEDSSGMGLCGLFTEKDLTYALTQFPKDRFIPHSEGEFPDTIYGHKIITTEELDPHSPVNFLLESGAFHIYGSCNGGVTATSEVITSLISKDVEELMGVPNIWGKPWLRPSWLGWHTCLSNFANPSNGFPSATLAWAKRDYLKPILEHLAKNPYSRAMLRKLTPRENINGVPGVRHLDGMQKGTSIGWPLSGPKRDHMIAEPPDELYSEPYTFEDEIFEEIERNRTILAKKERCYFIYKACVKDEPTDRTKVKAPRIIFASPIAKSYLVREYFLGLTRFMNTHPILFESMVGINCMGPEWQERRDIFTSEGKELDRTFAIDYSKYDQRLPQQLTVAAYEMFIEINMAGGNFTEEDRTIMEGLVTEVTLPVIAYNGTLVSTSGMNPSGTGMTVFANNGCNSLAQRCGFHDLELIPRGLDKEVYTFRSGVKAGNYGDDNGSVIAPWVKNYNMANYSQYCSIYGMTVTMADKSAEMVDFVHWDEADFLKRVDSYIPELGVHLGKLDNASIFKSLHSNLRNKHLSREELVKSVVECAIYEWFAHGRETYELRRSQLLEIVARHYIHVPALERSFDDMVRAWHDKYRPDPDQITDPAEG